jgi:perosamine synthetase
MGCAQMELLDDYIESKRETARFYGEALADVPGITCMRQAAWAESIAWMFTIRIDAGDFGLDSRALLHRLGAAKIQTRPLWQPIHQSPAHAGAQIVGGAVADALYQNCLSLPCSVGVTAAQRERVVREIKDAQRAAIQK